MLIILPLVTVTVKLRYHPQFNCWSWWHAASYKQLHLRASLIPYTITNEHSDS